MLFRYVAGRNVLECLKRADLLLNKGKTPVINFAVENTKNKEIVFSEYQKLNSKINEDYRVALKLSSLYFDDNLISKTVNMFKENNVKILIDAESDELNAKYQDYVNNLIIDHNQYSASIIKTYQMYRKDSLNTLLTDIEVFKSHNLWHGIKLVRGAYWNSEHKQGHLFTNKTDTNKSYNEGIYRIFKSENNKMLPILATHNTESINLGLLFNEFKPIFEFGHLMGMKEGKYKNIKYPVNVYIPYGPYDEMIPYLVRRLYENADSVKYMFN